MAVWDMRAVRHITSASVFDIMPRKQIPLENNTVQVRLFPDRQFDPVRIFASARDVRSYLGDQGLRVRTIVTDGSPFGRPWFVVFALPPITVRLIPVVHLTPTTLVDGVTNCQRLVR